MVEIQEIRTKLREAVDHFHDELKKVRAGRANPELVKDIKVTAYSTQMPLEQLANINVADPTLIVVQPWDKTIVNDIVKAIQSSNVGITPSVDGDLIRLPIPPLTTERREEYVKLMKQKAEESKISIRQKRKDFLLELEQEKKNGLSEDDFKRYEKDLQNIVDEMNKEIDNIAEAKEKELMQL
jgi:ribosome recycling factor